MAGQRRTRHLLSHDMYAMPQDGLKVYSEAKSKWLNPFVPYKVVTMELQVSTPDRKHGVMLYNPYMVMPEESPEGLYYYPLEITVL